MLGGQAPRGPSCTSTSRQYYYNLCYYCYYGYSYYCYCYYCFDGFIELTDLHLIFFLKVQVCKKSVALPRGKTAERFPPPKKGTPKSHRAVSLSSLPVAKFVADPSSFPCHCGNVLTIASLQSGRCLFSTETCRIKNRSPVEPLMKKTRETTMLMMATAAEFSAGGSESQNRPEPSPVKDCVFSSLPKGGTQSKYCINLCGKPCIQGYLKFLDFFPPICFLLSG